MSCRSLRSSGEFGSVAVYKYCAPNGAGHRDLRIPLCALAPLREPFSSAYCLLPSASCPPPTAHCPLLTAEYTHAAT